MDNMGSLAETIGGDRFGLCGDGVGRGWGIIGPWGWVGAGV
ncbi:hypothetical protein GGR47_001136 [Sphingomonas aquatilis]|uniref:Uncharacterized protein n=1 Tax=Sphingomonas aquatilis TaxID=93063 RepID=A0AAW3TPF3_9SPHN|nr:hypothetical protein [Sphingomonas aquatilis]